MKKTAVLLLPLLLTGCAGAKYVMEPITDIAGKSVVPIADASTVKELAVQETLKANAVEYYKAVSKSGFSMSYQEVTLADGSKTYLPAISWTPEPKIVTGLPNAPSPHPVWATLNTAIRTVTPWGFGYLAADSLFGALDSMNHGDTYHGDVRNMGSYNSSGRDQVITSQSPTITETITTTTTEAEDIITDNGGEETGE